ncbi:hypothetical protein KKG31_06850, partial [Patescibacteria group bacterium]|nr:hypothetical protein [Patescibacteria group bacterium]MBU1758808.1 hypothetical protein [Patescibacteria group bacterium]
TLVWAKKYNPELATLLESDLTYAKAAMNIERHTKKDPKRFTTFTDVEGQIMFFFDAEWEKLIKDVKRETYNVERDVVSKFISEYTEKLDLDMTVEEWFDQLKEIGKAHGFAGNNGEFKE